jgi:hypothetical protein
MAFINLMVIDLDVDVDWLKVVKVNCIIVLVSIKNIFSRFSISSNVLMQSEQDLLNLLIITKGA